jgi:hypothetical protein
MVEANPGCRNALLDSGEDFAICLLGSEPRPAVPFWTLDGTATGASAYKELTDFYDGVKPIFLKQKTLNDLLGGKRFDFIKMDTQGSELDIINGGWAVVSHCKALQLEISIRPYNRGAPYGKEVFDRLKDLGFVLVDCVNYCDAIDQGDYLFRNVN